jgi:hypothetical protein
MKAECSKFLKFYRSDIKTGLLKIVCFSPCEVILPIMFLNINFDKAIVLFGIVFVQFSLKLKPKIMKRYLLLFSISVVSLLCSSQTDKYDLSKYKLPDIKRQQLDFYFHSSGRNSSSKLFYEHDNILDTLKHKNDQFNGTYNFGYSFYRNSQKIQSFLTAITYGDYSKTKQNATNYYSLDYSNFNNNLSFNYDLKYFFTPSNWFVTAAPNYVLNYRNYRDYETDNKSKYFYTSASVSFGGGKGRIEQVQDFRHGILLIEELEKRGVSKRNFSETEMTELSTLISQLKNKRFFDYRKQKEAELVALDSFFLDKGIVDEKSIQYFTGLEDIWSYGGLQVRESGKQVLFSITPGYNFDKDLEDEDNNINENFLMNYNLSFVSKNPISLKWQGDYEFGVNHLYLKRLQQQNDNRGDKSYDSRAFINGMIGFYPNTRTYFELSSRINLSNRSDEKIFDKEKYSAGLIIVTSGYYYISEKLRLGCSIGYETSKFGIFTSNTENTYYKTFNYNLNVSYAIF